MIKSIPLNKLVRSPRNVRRHSDPAADAELKASIAAHGLLQNLIVRPAAKGKFEVEAGERRRRAMLALADEKILARDHEVTCLVLEDSAEAAVETKPTLDPYASHDLVEGLVRLPAEPAALTEAELARLDELDTSYDEHAATRKRELGVIDFSDMVTNAARILEEKPAVLGAVMEEVDCVIVDEFQDTNPIQFTFLWALARKAKRALIVGDTKQAIMGFQGADPRLTVALTRRTAERLRDVIALHFDVVDDSDGRTKRFRIRDALRRVYTRPTAAEIAALQAEVDARNREMAPQAALLSSLLEKTKAALDDREKRRVDPDLEALVRLQRSRVPAGPAVVADPENLATIQGAIMAGLCVEFDYRADGVELPRWRRVIPYGLVHGPITYLIGKMPDRNAEPVPFRLDRMNNVRAANTSGLPPTDWDLDGWLSQSFGIWREEDHAVVLRVLPSSAERARQWRFHPAQELEETGEGLIVRFRAGGLREIAEHLFTWGGEVVIEGPDALKAVMRQRLAEEQTLPTAFATMRRAGSSLQPGVPVNRLLKFPRGKFMMVSGCATRSRRFARRSADERSLKCVG